MTIASTVSRNDYVGNGLQSVFPYGFLVFQASDLAVVIQDTATPANLTVLVNGVDYTIDVVGAASGGNVTLQVSATLPAGVLPNGYGLALIREPALLQPTSIRNAGQFFPQTHEDEFDRLVTQLQWLQDQLTRALQAPATEPTALPLPGKASRANAFLAFNAQGLPIASTGGLNPAIPASVYMQTLLGSANAAAVLSALGFSAFVQTILGAASAAASRTLLGAAASFVSSQVVCDSGNGHGSSSTKIRRFTNATQTGTDVTYADSPTLGASFTVNTAGLYSLSYTDYAGATGSSHGFSLNASGSDLTTSITAIATAKRILATDSATNIATSISAVARLAVNDVVRAHTSGANDATSTENQFRMVRIG